MLMDICFGEEGAGGYDSHSVGVEAHCYGSSLFGMLGNDVT
jgi:hypothetical protein